MRSGEYAAIAFGNRADPFVSAHWQNPDLLDEPQLLEDAHQARGEPRRTPMRAVSAEQAPELLAGRIPAVPQGPVERHERSTQAVLRLMDLLRKA